MPFTPDEEAAIEKILIDLAKTEEGRALLRRYAEDHGIQISKEEAE
ncbi:MAG: hypothetical protein QMC82_03435 [Methanolinea sp.]|jgi:hypothetical protein|nr:hypothetical protein [Methanolinea sp.]